MFVLISEEVNMLDSFLPYITGFGDISRQLIQRYFTFGWFFAIAHFVVIYYIFLSWRQITREILTLKEWGNNSLGRRELADRMRNQDSLSTIDNSPAKIKGSLNRIGKTTTVLSLFVEECEQLGKQGFFVPMTDFSDRLDSTMEGMIAELHDRINLLLYVGIAGTLFGVFEFSYKARVGGPVSTLAEALSDSMSKAFPVGFMGIVLTIIFQIWATSPESKLREALSRATQKALRIRKEVSISQATLVEQATERIQSGLRPLEDLRQTLTESIEPVVKDFGERLEKSLELVKVQFDQLDKTTKGVHEAVGSIHDGIDLLGKTASSLKKLVKDTPEVLANLNTLQQQQIDSLHTFNQGLSEHRDQASLVTSSLDKTLKEIEAFAHTLNSLPRTLSENTKAVFGELAQNSLAAWNTAASDLMRNVQTEYTNYINAINTRENAITESIHNANKELEILANQAYTLLERPVAGAIDTVKREVTEGLQKLDQVLAVRYPEAISNIQSLTSSLADVMHQIQRVQGEFATWLKDAERSREVISSIHVGLTEMLKDFTQPDHRLPKANIVSLLETNSTQLVEMNQLMGKIHGALPHSGDGLGAKVDNSVRLLEQINLGIDRLNTKEKKGFFHRIIGT
ncbi:MAG: hypothetical protein LAO31_19675 [Acidobacteriia bacterium]|nr:hypothetical protein [Terriglobia bacterium]